MIERPSNRIKSYVDHPKDRSKITCLIHGPGNSSYECDVLGDLGSKYYKISPTKDHRQDPTTKNIFQTAIEQCYFSTCSWWDNPAGEQKFKCEVWNTWEHWFWGWWIQVIWYW